MKFSVAIILSTVALAGCQTVETYTPMEVALNKAAGADVLAQKCGYLDYRAVQQVYSDKNKNMSEAKSLGATKSDYSAAYDRVNGRVTTAMIFAGTNAACNELLTQLAKSNSEANIDLPD
ncbi:hypothetical protein [Martelella endophytica]|uniref:hypothetical protein n=1 Tax=Martelella endophytica TaxID=1486262 RepID=UPI000AC2CC9F|nr:hypothetical protein [Martelella endophytica]